MSFVKYESIKMGQNCYILWDDESLDSFIIDPGEDTKTLHDFIDDKKLKIKGVLLTHAHADHFGGVKTLIKNHDCDIYVHKDDLYILENVEHNSSRLLGMGVIEFTTDKFLSDGDILTFGSQKLKVIHTKGHSPGGVCFYYESEKALFSGDTIFRGSIGRTDFEGGSMDEIISSIREQIFALPKDTVIYPGHGPETTIEYEINNNPFAGINV